MCILSKTLIITSKNSLYDCYNSKQYEFPDLNFLDGSLYGFFYLSPKSFILWESSGKIFWYSRSFSTKKELFVSADHILDVISDSHCIESVIITICNKKYVKYFLLYDCMDTLIKVKIDLKSNELPKFYILHRFSSGTILFFALSNCFYIFQAEAPRRFHGLNEIFKANPFMLTNEFEGNININSYRNDNLVEISCENELFIIYDTNDEMDDVDDLNYFRLRNYQFEFQCIIDDDCQIQIYTHITDEKTINYFMDDNYDETFTLVCTIDQDNLLYEIIIATKVRHFIPITNTFLIRTNDSLECINHYFYYIVDNLLYKGYIQNNIVHTKLICNIIWIPLNKNKVKSANS